MFIGVASCGETARRGWHRAGQAAIRPPILKAIFPVNGSVVGLGKQSALGLREVQVDRALLAAGGEQLPDIVHMLARLMFCFKLLQRDQRRRQSFRDDPIVVAGDSFFGISASPKFCDSARWNGVSLLQMLGENPDHA